MPSACLMAGFAYEDTRGQAEKVFTFIANKRGDGFTSLAN